MSKEQLIADYKAKTDAALGDLVDAAQAEVVVGPGGITPEQEAADLAAAVAPLHAEIDALGLKIEQVKSLKESLAALLASLG